MKKTALNLIFAILIFTTGFAFANSPLKVFVDDKEVKNNGDYIIKDDKVYVSESALENELGFNVFYEKDQNKIRLYNLNKTALECKSNMLEQFVDAYKFKTPDEAAQLWAKGTKERNGAEQYIALNKNLKEEFKKMTEEMDRKSWVTGFSSPWIENYEIKKVKLNESTWEYKIVFKAMTSEPKEYTYNATLTVGKEDGSWRITKIQKDFDTM